MLKGCQKKVIQIKSPKSEIIEEAYFILKERENEPDECDIVREAERLLAACDQRENPKKHFRFSLDEVLFFFAGVALSLVFWCVLRIFM